MNPPTDRNENAENERLLGDNATVPQIYGSSVPVLTFFINTFYYNYTIFIHLFVCFHFYLTLAFM